MDEPFIWWSERPWNPCPRGSWEFCVSRNTARLGWKASRDCKGSQTQHSPDRMQADKTTQLKFHCCHFHEKESKSGREEPGAQTVEPRVQGSELRATTMVTPKEVWPAGFQNCLKKAMTTFYFPFYSFFFFCIWVSITVILCLPHHHRMLGADNSLL